MTSGTTDGRAAGPLTTTVCPPDGEYPAPSTSTPGEEDSAAPEPMCVMHQTLASLDATSRIRPRHGPTSEAPRSPPTKGQRDSTAEVLPGANLSDRMPQCQGSKWSCSSPRSRLCSRADPQGDGLLGLLWLGPGRRETADLDRQDPMQRVGLRQ